MAGIRNTMSLADLEKIDKKSYDELLMIMERLEKHYRDLCDIEFTNCPHQRATSMPVQHRRIRPTHVDLHPLVQTNSGWRGLG